MHLNYVDSRKQNAQFGDKWLSYMLMTVALILWVVFNIVSIQNYQFPPYLLVLMNLILYFIIAAMINPDKYSS